MQKRGVHLVQSDVDVLMIQRGLFDSLPAPAPPPIMFRAGRLSVRLPDKAHDPERVGRKTLQRSGTDPRLHSAAAVSVRAGVWGILEERMRTSVQAAKGHGWVLPPDKP